MNLGGTLSVITMLNSFPTELSRASVAVQAKFLGGATGRVVGTLHDALTGGLTVSVPEGAPYSDSDIGVWGAVAGFVNVLGTVMVGADVSFTSITRVVDAQLPPLSSALTVILCSPIDKEDGIVSVGVIAAPAALVADDATHFDAVDVDAPVASIKHQGALMLGSMVAAGGVVPGDVADADASAAPNGTFVAKSAVRITAVTVMPIVDAPNANAPKRRCAS
ncbi:MAG: hypothetical protein OXU37_05185 [Thaumarchaeota archaeon]|nr:hypothetical protein [Nitrososphaerota archaeon]